MAKKKTKRTKSPLAKVEAVAARQWSPVPGDDDARVPTSIAAVEAMETVLATLADEVEADDELAAQIGVYVRTCVWARKETFVGVWSAILGGALGTVALVLIGKDAGTDWLAASMVWAAAVPLYMQAAVSRQVDVNKRVVAGEQTPDERFTAWVAKGPPLMTPLWLVVRVLFYAVFLPAIVAREAINRRRMVVLLALGGVTAGAYAFALWEPLAIPEDDVAAEASEAPPARPGAGATPEAPAAAAGDAPAAAPAPAAAASPSTPASPFVVLDGVAHDVSAGPVTLTSPTPPDTSALGDPDRTDDRSAGGCAVLIRSWTALGVRERSTRCAGQAETTYEYAPR